MRDSRQDRVIALAGVTQAVALVDQLARSGYLDTRSFETCVRGLLELNPTSTESVFGGLQNLERGLTVLSELLESQRVNDRSGQLLSYCLGIFHLQRRLSRNKKMLAEIGRRLQQTQSQVDHFGPTHDNVIASLADTYTATISTFQFRIHVVGEYQYLQQSRVANQVRVLLFAAIRSAMLWQQVGGARWQLLLQRGKTARQAQLLLAEIRSRP